MAGNIRDGAVLTCLAGTKMKAGRAMNFLDGTGRCSTMTFSFHDETGR